MLNLLEDYISHSVPDSGWFRTHPNLANKVDREGHMLPYRGNTAVFLLDGQTKERLEQLREELYGRAGDMLADRLHTSTFHMTLHDLENGKPEKPGLAEAMARTQEAAAGILERLRDREPLRMRTSWMFNMMNTSVVLGLAPASGRDWERLDRMYMELESVVRLGYGLTPHITMAYYKFGDHGPDRLDRLRSALRPVEMTVELRMEDLVLQNFEDMNHYVTVRPKGQRPEQRPDV